MYFVAEKRLCFLLEEEIEGYNVLPIIKLLFYSIQFKYPKTSVKVLYMY